MLARLGVNGAFRVVYPFAAVIALGLDVSLQTLALVIAARNLAGLAGPGLVRLAATAGWYRMMMISQIMVAVGCVAVLSAAMLPPGPRLLLIALGFAATGLARPLSDLLVQSWVATRVIASARGRAIGVTELGWSLSLAATVTLGGFLIDSGGWPSVFVLVIGLSVAGLMATRRIFRSVRSLPATRRGIEPQTTMSGRLPAKPPTGPATPTSAPPASAPSSLQGGSSTFVLCLLAGLTVAAGNVLFLSYGEWLRQDFAMSAAAIGMSTALVVCAELFGAGLMITLSDRCGLHRTLIGALLVLTLTFLALGAIGENRLVALSAIVVWFVAFEVAIITLKAVATTLPSPHRPGRIFGWLTACIAVGNALGTAMAPLLFGLGGIATAGIAAACCTGAAAMMAGGAYRRPRRVAVLS